MTDALPVIERGTAETHGDHHLLRFTLRLPHPVPRVWAAVASSEGLRGWLAAADPFEPRIGGAITLRWLNTDPDGNATVASGTVTAWDVERVAEYTLEGVHGRIRFHLEPPRGDHVLLRFSNEFHGDDALRLDCLAGWHNHFEYLVDALDGHPVDWSRWTLTRWRELRESYGAEDGGKQF
ncbi:MULTISPECIES: SRPBCC domain-containing protein [unclassified Streptomyces]|uniref:SRPBCC domain-containing protein n=1 Tax=unclassified Streptomyces TaxID=2593676 RepID=UPI002255DA01|nr:MULTISPECIES: SRPBCC domain-containing protein [unclassified Streptomyces]MCX4534462.1 SRPBCC domain-containing protein [Streptomyces sp. NBC_01669]WSA00187.1 SRPBCC domain-containing protein [Streptomyces sp. NBC_00841]WSJ97081.1 SRPBCC domain-containing protein [Streptomyces sp. NBC_01320]